MLSLKVPCTETHSQKKREPVNPVPAFFFRVKSGRKFWKSIFVLKKKVLASFWLFGKNTDNSEKILRKSGKYYWEEYVNFGKRKDKIRSSLHFDRKTQKNTWNSKTYTGNSEKITQFWKTQKKYRKSGKIPRKTRKNISETLRKQGPHLILIEESGKILNIWKKYSRHIRKKSLEKYYWKLGKILPKNPVPGGKIAFPTMLRGYLEWKHQLLKHWGAFKVALPFEVPPRCHLRSFGAAIRGPWSKTLGTKSRTNIFKFLGFIDHSDQNELYHTPLLSKIWELINKKRCKTIQLSHMSSPDHWGGAWTKGRPLADHGRRLQESQPTVWASGFFCQSLDRSQSLF